MDFIGNSNERTTTTVKQGLRIPRVFTNKGSAPESMFEYELRSSVIRNPDGSVVFELNNIEIPKTWSQVATDIIAQKYFRKAGVPQVDEDGNPLIDEFGKPLLGSERSAKQVVQRLAGCWRWWGERHDYFASQEDAQTFEDELKFMLLSQMAAPNSPQWFTTGLNWAYGINGPPQGHWYTDPQTGEVQLSKDAYSRSQPHACFIQSVKDDLVSEGGIMDLAVREARLFKYGSGTGSNFSKLRAEGEPLSGGGKSSGLMSWLKIFDRAAGAVKSGGTTRRAAKMVCLDLDHPDIETFINWKVIEEQKVAALVAGSHVCDNALKKIIAAAKVNPDTTQNAELRQAIKQGIDLDIPANYILRCLQLLKEGVEPKDFPVFDTHYESEAYQTVAGQNSNNSIRIPNAFFDVLEQKGEWALIRRTDNKVSKKVNATKLWDDVAYAAWSCADPGVQYDTTINEWHTCPNDGRINASNPCSEYMFLDDTACNLASINLAQFLDHKTMEFAAKEFRHAVRLWTIVLEISVLMAQFPSKPIAEKSYEFRTLGLGYANLGTILMRKGIAYDSEQGRSICAAITSIMCGQSYATSAEMAKVLGPFAAYERNKNDMLRVIRNHRRAAYDAAPETYENLTMLPVGINQETCPSDLLSHAKDAWDKSLQWGQDYGFRNAQVTVIAPTGTIGLVMDCDTTGIEPDFALVKFKKLAGGGYFKIVNQSVPYALRTLGYDNLQIQEMIKYVKGHGTLVDCPHLNAQALANKGFTAKELDAIEQQLPTAFDLNFVFNRHTFGDAFCKEVLNISEQELNSPKFNMLQHLGFTKAQIEEANEYVCGTMTIEGAPFLKDEHLSVFDCANRCGKKGQRYIRYKAHIEMMAAAQPFISGAISKTINMANDVTVDDIKYAYTYAWKRMVKAVALYRDSSKLSQPLNTSVEDLFNIDVEDDVDETITPQRIHEAVLPTLRAGIVQEARVGGHNVIVRTSTFQDGALADVDIDMYKRGSPYGELMHAFAQSVSIGLQNGVPLSTYVDTFTFTKFEPSGVVNGHPNVKTATSVVDFVFRSLAHDYLGREDLVHVKSAPQAQPTAPRPVQKPRDEKRDAAIAKGYTGDTCSSCGSMNVKLNGTCTLCDDCGNTSGCS